MAGWAGDPGEPHQRRVAVELPAGSSYQKGERDGGGTEQQSVGVSERKSNWQIRTFKFLFALKGTAYGTLRVFNAGAEHVQQFPETGKGRDTPTGPKK